MARPLILISNDDGFDIPGIRFLASVCRQWGDVIVVAPDGPRSGAAMSVTFQTPLRLRLISQEPGLMVYACNGTPVDCIKLALSQICRRTPDLVLGGINHGDNSAVNVHYSGTMGIVMEGCMKGIPSVGFSHQSHSMDTDFEPMRVYINKVVKYVVGQGLPQGVCLNVNAPDVAQYLGMKVCRMGRGVWQNELERRNHPRGGEYYWMVGDFNTENIDAADSDYQVMRQGYVTVTPIKIDVTAYDMIDKLNSLND